MRGYNKSHFPLFKSPGDLAEKYNCMIQSHMSESIDEVEFSARLFGFSDAEVFSSFGLLRGKPGPGGPERPGGPQVQAAAVMAHCVQMQKAEERLLKEPELIF